MNDAWSDEKPWCAQLEFCSDEKKTLKKILCNFQTGNDCNYGNFCFFTEDYIKHKTIYTFLLYVVQRKIPSIDTTKCHLMLAYVV